MRAILSKDRLLFSLAGVLMLMGVVALAVMPRQEDPAFPYRTGIVSAPLPGADAESVARVVLRPIERQIAQVEGVKEVTASARQGFGVLTIRLNDSIYDTAPVWDRVRIAMDRAGSELPAGVPRPDLDDRVIGTAVAVYAVSGSPDALVLRDAAAVLRDRLSVVSGVESTRLIGEPVDEIQIRVSPAVLGTYQISTEAIATAIQQRARPGQLGMLNVGTRQLTLVSDLDPMSVEEVRAIPVRTGSGAVLPLGAFANVERHPAEPVAQRYWADGKRAVGVEVRAATNTIDTVKLGARIRENVVMLESELAPLVVEEVFYQPAYTQERLGGLLGSLVLAIVLILAVLFIALGLRAALVVATVLPFVAASSLAVYAFGGGVLHQIVVMGLVVALGILVDNAIVMVESVQRNLEEGYSRMDAMVRSVRELAGPLLTATGTTIAAFLPLLLSKGATADFTRAIPLAIAISLLVSYAYAIFVSPLVASRFLHAGAPPTRASEAMSRLGEFAAKTVRTHRWRALAVGIGLMAASLACAPLMEREFFPEADRPAIILEVVLPEGVTAEATDAVSARVERFLREDPGVGAIQRFVGFSGPAFYYNLSRHLQESARARLLVETSGLEHNLELVERLEQWNRQALPEADLIPIILRQGPPVLAPIEVRVFNEDPEALGVAAERIARIVEAEPGTRNVRNSLESTGTVASMQLGSGLPELSGIELEAIQTQIGAYTQGVRVGTYRGGAEPAALVLQFERAAEDTQESLLGLPMGKAGESTVPLSQLTDLDVLRRPALVDRRDLRRVATVTAEIRHGVGSGNVEAALRTALADLELSPGTQVSFGGDAQASGEANQAIIQAAPVGVIVFMVFLLVQFNSLRRLGLVLASIPFAVAGVFPALLLSGMPFGFQPLQGVIALIGITVNNAILLLSAVDEAQVAGAPLDEAIEEAIRRRTRPILLTSATTIAGLLPLTWSSSTLWPPMAWAMIGGLVASAFISLLALPALVRMVLGWQPWMGRRVEGARQS